ncbi:hypothetical protein SAMN05216249_10110 [Acetitomaculum ruminis DSM 5522]|uniref:Uncharacterized protein n=1 Tax=Acetitomaculum ruminis DSM 5522 TaxID=1120918 RepID=A0A1I0UXW1_9FIRM|nr:hypothetical protein [Acetitomaculum ruminis]SFA68700.1 hypothetical protein SAMN05216249_10110 [Acetitomaculum ruminis DSM 5522]
MRISGSSFNNQFNMENIRNAQKDTQNFNVGDVNETASVEIKVPEVFKNESQSDDKDFLYSKKRDNLDISSLYHYKEFELIGKDSDIFLLDKEKFISDVAKDQVLSSYQYFVQSSNIEGKNNAFSNSLEDFIIK